MQLLSEVGGAASSLQFLGRIIMGMFTDSLFYSSILSKVYQTEMKVEKQKVKEEKKENDSQKVEVNEKLNS